MQPASLDNGEEEDEDDPFEQALLLQSRTTQKRHFAALPSLPTNKRARNSITKPIEIRIHSLPPSDVAAAAHEVTDESQPGAACPLAGGLLTSDVGGDHDRALFFHDDEDYYDDDLDSDEEDEEAERALSFYQDAHEDQDPAYQAFERTLRIQALQKKLGEIDEADARSRNEIDDFIRQQLEEKQRTTSASLEKYRARVDAEQARALQRLQQVFEQKVQSNQQRIQKGVQVLRERHAKELQALQQRLQQQGQQSSFPQAQAQLTAKSQRQLTEFGAKGEEVKKKTESDYKAEIEKIRSNHSARLVELSANRKKIIDKLTASFQQVRQRYLKRHLQRIMRQKDRILAVIQGLIAANNAASGGIGGDGGGGRGGAAVPGRGAADATGRQKRPPSSALSSPMLLSPSRSPLRASTTATASALAVGSPEGTAPDPAGPSESAEEDKAEFRQPSPITSVQPWVVEHYGASSASATATAAATLDDPSSHSPASERRRAGAAARHKHRKAISGQVTRQLSVEVHNEGLWVSFQQHDDDASKKLEGKSSNSTGALEEEFLVWGTRARSVLESISCGEIPPGYDRTPTDSSDPLGGQLRCVVTDLRTSEETASAQRAQATREFEASQIADLEAKCKELILKVNEAEAAVSKLQEKEREGTAAVENAASDVAKAKRMQDEFLTKFRNYIGSDGNVLETPNPKDREELQKALLNYKTNIDNVSRQESRARLAVSEIQAHILKFQGMARSSQTSLASVTELLKKRKFLAAAAMGDIDPSQAKSALETAEQDRASIRVKDVIACLRKTAEIRREHMNDKKSGNASSTWVQSFPDLPTSLKKSLWHKMHRRKHQIVLRPSAESMMNQLRSHVSESRKNLQERRSTSLEDDLIRAEKLYLLATHPISSVELSTTPATKTGENWAEPGWHLLLDVPERTSTDASRILPCYPSFPVLENNLSEIASAPGRQAASFLKSLHFRCLASPLSSVGVASSPAESCEKHHTRVEGDPLLISDQSLSTGYTFALNKLKVPRATPLRRRTSIKDAAASGDASTSRCSDGLSSKKGTGGLAPPELANVKKDVRPKQNADLPKQQAKNEPKRRRSSKGSGEPSTIRPRKGGPASDHNVKDASTSFQREAQSGSGNISQAASAQAAAAAAAAATAHYNQYMQQMPMQPTGSPHNQMAASLQQQSMQQFVPQNQPRPPPLNPSQSQFSSSQQRQLAQLRMMQQQSPHRQQMPPNYPPQQMPVQQFYNPLSHPSTPGRSPFPQQPPNVSAMHMQGRSSVSMSGQAPTLHAPPTSGAPPPPPQQQQQQQPDNQGPPEGNPNDPLFMLK